jgi:uncharacterized phiE125 gp8 family phage protein
MTEPVSTTLAKQHLGIEASFTADDALIGGYVTAARELVEEIDGEVLLVRRSVTEYKDGWGDWITLYKRPIAPDAEVTIAYIDEGEAEQPFTAFVARLARVPARIYRAAGTDWPTLSPNGGVTVTYPAGYADGQVPQRYIQAILLLTAHFYETREPVNMMSGLPQELQFTVSALINKQPVIG